MKLAQKRETLRVSLVAQQVKDPAHYWVALIIALAPLPQNSMPQAQPKGRERERERETLYVHYMYLSIGLEGIK